MLLKRTYASGINLEYHSYNSTLLISCTGDNRFTPLLSVSRIMAVIQLASLVRLLKL